MNDMEPNGQVIQDIRRILRLQLPRLKHDYSISSLEVFGSYVRGDQTQASDIDLLVEFEITPSLFRFIELEDELTGILKIKVDLVMKAGLKPALGAVILGEAIPV